MCYIYPNYFCKSLMYQAAIVYSPLSPKMMGHSKSFQIPERCTGAELTLCNNDFAFKETNLVLSLFLSAISLSFSVLVQVPVYNQHENVPRKQRMRGDSQKRGNFN